VDGTMRSRLITGLALIGMGLGLFGLQYLGDAGRPLLLALIGCVMIAGYLANRSGLLLVAGGILLGLGVGAFGERRWLMTWEFTELGLGFGFLAIYLIRLVWERRSHWWPLIPGAVLLLLGFQKWRDARRFLFSSHGWPLLLVFAGVLVVLGAIGRGRRASQPADGSGG